MPLLDTTHFEGITGLGPWTSNMNLLAQEEDVTSFQHVFLFFLPRKKRKEWDSSSS